LGGWLTDCLVIFQVQAFETETLLLVAENWNFNESEFIVSKGLRPFTNYTISIAATNEIGYGVSYNYTAVTEEYCK